MKLGFFSKNGKEGTLRYLMLYNGFVTVVGATFYLARYDERSQFVLDTITHGLSAIAMHPNAPEVVKDISSLVNVARMFELGNNLFCGTGFGGAAAQIPDLLVHAANALLPHVPVVEEESAHSHCM